MSDIRIVLVEDNEDDAELTIRTLKNSNISNEIVWLKDGEEAIDYFNSTGKYAENSHPPKPQLVLMDLKMPKVSGLEVLKAIKDKDQLKDVPFVVMTSSSHDKDLKECYQYGANSYVVKPIEFEDFTKMVKEIGLYWSIINRTPKSQS